jgi:hypothetical protein
MTRSRQLFLFYHLKYGFPMHYVLWFLSVWSMFPVIYSGPHLPLADPPLSIPPTNSRPVQLDIGEMGRPEFGVVTSIYVQCILSLHTVRARITSYGHKHNFCQTHISRFGTKPCTLVIYIITRSPTRCYPWKQTPGHSLYFEPVSQEYYVEDLFSLVTTCSRERQSLIGYRLGSDR